MIPKRSRQRVTPVLRFVELGQLGLERHHYSLGVANSGSRPVGSKTETVRPGSKREQGRGQQAICLSRVAASPGAGVLSTAPGQPLRFPGAGPSADSC